MSTVQIPLHIESDAGATATMHVPAPAAIIVGRQPGCDLVLESDQVSRAHARLILGSGTFIVEDLSSNGTSIGDGSILRHGSRELAYGEHVRMGPFTMRVGDPPRARREARATTAPGRRAPTAPARPPP